LFGTQDAIFLISVMKRSKISIVVKNQCICFMRTLARTYLSCLKKDQICVC